jgi:alcohol dehydrogenase class IV
VTDKNLENLLSNHDWSFPVPIAYGPGRLETLGQQASALALTNPLIVTDKGSAELPFIQTLQQALSNAGIESAVFSEVAPNPKDSILCWHEKPIAKAGTIVSLPSVVAVVWMRVKPLL